MVRLPYAAMGAVPGLLAMLARSLVVAMIVAAHAAATQAAVPDRLMNDTARFCELQHYTPIVVQKWAPLENTAALVNGWWHTGCCRSGFDYAQHPA